MLDQLLEFTFREEHSTVFLVSVELTGIVEMFFKIEKSFIFSSLSKKGRLFFNANNNRFLDLPKYKSAGLAKQKMTHGFDA